MNLSSVNSANTTTATTATVNSKSPFSFFTRLRYRKRDKIKANVEQKIRAVRAAEALDRQTNLRRNRAPPRQSSLLMDSTTAAAGEDSQSSMAQQTQVDTHKLKLLNLWKHAYLDELAKIPGLLEFIDNFKEQFVIVAPADLAVVGKSRRAVSMVLPKTNEATKEQPAANGILAIANGKDKTDDQQQKQQQIEQKTIVDKTDSNAQAEKSNTAVQTSFDLLPQLRCEQQQQQQKKLQHLQNISIVKTPLSRLRPSRTAEQKRMDYEQTIAELKKQAIEVENRIRKQQKSDGEVGDRKTTTKRITGRASFKQTNADFMSKKEWTMDGNKQQSVTAEYDEYDESEISVGRLSPPPPPIISSSKYSILNRQKTADSLKHQQQHEPRFDSSAAAVAALQNLQTIQSSDPHYLPTAEELILRVNQLSCEPSTTGQYMGPIPPPNQLSSTTNQMKTTTSTVRVQSQYRSPGSLAASSGGLSGLTGNATITSSHQFPQSSALDNALQQHQNNDAIMNSVEKNRAYHHHRRIPSWSKEQQSAVLISNEKNALYDQFARMSLAAADHRYESGGLVAEKEEKQHQFESKESLIIEESASENEEDSSAAIYKRIIISLRNSTTDLADNDYQISRHSSHQHSRPSSSHHPSSSHLHHQYSSTSSSSNQHHSSDHPASHTYQTNYTAFYEQMQQLHQQHQQKPEEDCYFQSRQAQPMSEYSAENIVDEQEEELISAFSSMSRSEPSSARQSRKY